MKSLGDIESRDLFMKKAFGGNTSFDECPEELKKVGEEILKKCGGLPLAISVVGGLLAKKTRLKSEWEKVHEDMKSHLERSKDLNNISGILELSYQNLPLELKACFLCLGFFKENATIKVKELVQTWIAHGLVAQEVVGERESMEEVARDYIKELISRNMIQVKELVCDVIKGCQMHDLLRDLSIRKAKEEIHFEEVRLGGSSNQHSLAKPRHRAIYCTGEDSIFSTGRTQHLRSLFVHLEGGHFHNSDGPSSYWKSLELLRFLDMGYTKLDVLPKGIGELTGLRYLKIMRGGLTRLPRSWAKLKNLEVLDLGDSPIKIDKEILKMKSLRHLNAVVSFCNVGLGNMRNLQTVRMFVVRSRFDIWKIQGMNGVSKLGIKLCDMTYVRSYLNGADIGRLFAHMSSLENLFHLTISSQMMSDDYLMRLAILRRVTRLKLDLSPLPESFPPNLSHLTLSQMEFKEEDPMPVLEKLPNLLSLKLVSIFDVKSNRIMAITSGGFPKLKFLRLKDIEETWKMKIEESAMPELNQFIISNSPNVDVENVPDRIKSAIVRPH